jgi:hypothetical protein
MIASVSRRRQHSAMSAARMIGMAMGDQRARHRLRRIDPSVGGGEAGLISCRDD